MGLSSHQEKEYKCITLSQLKADGYIANFLTFFNSIYLHIWSFFLTFVASMKDKGKSKILEYCRQHVPTSSVKIP